MTTSDALRYSRIQLTHGSGAIPAVGFGTLIPDLVATEQATKTALEVGFRHFDCAERYGNEASVGTRCTKHSRRKPLRGKTCSSPRSCGIPIIARSGSSPHSMRVAVGCKSTTSIAI